MIMYTVEQDMCLFTLWLTLFLCFMCFVLHCTHFRNYGNRNQVAFLLKDASWAIPDDARLNLKILYLFLMSVYYVHIFSLYADEGEQIMHETFT